MILSDIIYLFILFFITGIFISAVGILFLRLRNSLKKRKRCFSQPAKYVPELDLQIEKVQPSVDNSTAAKDFKIQGTGE